MLIDINPSWTEQNPLNWGSTVIHEYQTNKCSKIEASTVNVNQINQNVIEGPLSI